MQYNSTWRLAGLVSFTCIEKLHGLGKMIWRQDRHGRLRAKFRCWQLHTWWELSIWCYLSQIDLVILRLPWPMPSMDTRTLPCLLTWNPLHYLSVEGLFLVGNLLDYSLLSKIRNDAFGIQLHENQLINVIERSGANHNPIFWHKSSKKCEQSM